MVKGVKTSAGKGFENLRIVLVIFGVERIRRQPCCLGSERESERDYGFMLDFYKIAGVFKLIEVTVGVKF